MYAMKLAPQRVQQVVGHGTGRQLLPDLLECRDDPAARVGIAPAHRRERGMHGIVAGGGLLGSHGVISRARTTNGALATALAATGENDAAVINSGNGAMR